MGGYPSGQRPRLEVGRYEGVGGNPNAWRSRVGLEPPLKARLYRERLFVVAPPAWYDLLVATCVLAGFGSAGLELIGHPIIELWPMFWLFFGTLVGLSGLWAALSTDRFSADIRSGAYVRVEGHRFLRGVRRGHIRELQAIALLSELSPVPNIAGRSVVYRLALYWHGGAMPVLVYAQQGTTVPPFGPINTNAGKIAYFGGQQARFLNIPFYDLSYMHSPGPMPVF
jgi:hypothetical protein